MPTVPALRPRLRLLLRLPCRLLFSPSLPFQAPVRACVNGTAKRPGTRDKAAGATPCALTGKARGIMVNGTFPCGHKQEKFADQTPRRRRFLPVARPAYFP